MAHGKYIHPASLPLSWSFLLRGGHFSSVWQPRQACRPGTTFLLLRVHRRVETWNCIFCQYCEEAAWPSVKERMRTSCTDSETVCAGVFDGLIWFERAIKSRGSYESEAKVFACNVPIPDGDGRHDRHRTRRHIGIYAVASLDSSGFTTETGCEDTSRLIGLSHCSHCSLSIPNTSP